MLAPLDPRDWSLDHAAHLLGRAGFGGTPEQIRGFHSLGLDAAVELLISARDSNFAAPSWATEPATPRREMRMTMRFDPDSERKRDAMREAMREERDRLIELRGWWLRRMRADGQPLVEKMTLFWHGHFATSVAKVRHVSLMWRQNETLRKNALGDFRTMLQAMARDPAMIRWLDLNQSKVGGPNENFARELMELFTLGIGHYSEDDVKAAARAFTGHRIDPSSEKFFFARRAHDYGASRFMGHGGHFDGDAIIDIILQQPACASFLAGRIWEFFAYENPEPAMLESAASVLRGSGYQIAPLLSAIFRSAAFYSKRAARTHIKSPVEWLVQTCIALEIDVPGPPMRDNLLAQLGQLLFEPPNVRGWEGGKSWISTSTLVLRYNAAAYLAGASGSARRPDRRADPGPNIAKLAPAVLREKPDALADALVFRLFGATKSPRLHGLAAASIAAAGQPITDADARAIFQRLMGAPDFQLS